MGGRAMRARIRRPLLIALAALVAVALVGAASEELRAGFQTPTPAVLPRRSIQVPEPPTPQNQVVVPDPGIDPASVPVSGKRVRLKQTVMVQVSPSADSPRPAISLLGAGQIATLVDVEGEWALIEFGPLRGWTRAENVEEVQ